MPTPVDRAARPGHPLVEASPGRGLVPLLCAVAAVALWLPGGFRALGIREQLVLSALSVTLLAIAALHLVLGLPDGGQAITRWRIGPWYLLWSTLTFGIAPLTWLLPQVGSANRIALPSVLTALALFGVSLVPWTAGYCAGAPRAVRRLARRGVAVLLHGTTPVLRGGSMPWVLYGTGTAARLLTVALTGRFGYVGDPRALVSHAGALDHVFKLLSTFALFAVAAAAYRAFSDSTRGSKVTLWTLVAMEAVVGGLAGGKQYFLLSVLAVLIPYGALRGRLSLRILLAGAVVFLWIAVPFNTAYRQVVRSDASTLAPSAAVAAAPEVLSNVIAGTSVGEVMAASSIQMLRRVRMIDSVAITAQLTPQTIPYRSPLEFASAPVVGLIPRALWPDKPILTTGYEFSQEYYGTSPDSYTSAGITPLGDLYRHGGLATVLVGMLLLGMGARVFDGLFRPEVDPRAICFLLAFLPMLLRADIYGMVVGIPSSVVLAVVGARLMCRGTAAPGPVP
jgi:hypothetical protein